MPWLPENRGCPRGWRLHNVLRNQRSQAVYVIHGFEVSRLDDETWDIDGVEVNLDNAKELLDRDCPNGCKSQEG